MVRRSSVFGISTDNGISPIDFTGASPRLAWNTAQLCMFMGIMLGVWMIILIIWEKLHFILSIEWWINIITVLLRFKKKPNLYIKERIYGPGTLEQEKKLEVGDADEYPREFRNQP